MTGSVRKNDFFTNHDKMDVLCDHVYEMEMGY